MSSASESVLAISVPEGKPLLVKSSTVEDSVDNKKRLIRQATPERSVTESKDDEASSINMSFSTPKSVDNDDAPPIVVDTNNAAVTMADLYEQNAQPQHDTESVRLVAKLDSIQKAHVKNKSWDSNTHPSDAHHHHPSDNNPTGLLAKVPLHMKSKSEDYERSGKEKPKFQSNIQFWEMRSRFGPSHTPDLVMDLPLSVSTGPGSHTGESTTGSSSPSSSGSSSPTAESPESVVMTAAECFAKQDQCTLKKNHPLPVKVGDGSMEPGTAMISSSGKQQSFSESFGSRIVEEASSSSSTFHAAKSLKGLFENKDPKIGIAKPQVKVKPQVLKKPLFPTQLIEQNENKQSGSSSSASPGSSSSASSSSPSSQPH